MSESEEEKQKEDEISDEKLEKKDFGKMTIEDKSTESNEFSESSDLFIYQTQKQLFEIPFQLENPLTFNESKTDRNGRRSPKISINQLVMNLDPEKSVGRAFDKLWMESSGPPRISFAELLNQFHCYAMVLQVLSSFFRRPKLSHSHIFHLPSSMISARAFVAMYRWSLEPSNTLSLNQLMEVFRAARFFGCQELIDNCWRGIDAASCVPDQAVCIYMCSKAIGLHLEEGLLTRLSSIFLQFVASQEFLLVGADTVRRLLGLSSLAVNTEMEVFLAGILWLDYQWPQRKNHALDIMEAVRFHLLPFVSLLSVIKQLDGPPVLHLVTGAPIIRQRALQAIKDIHKSPEKFHRRGEKNGRTWIYDSRAPYHHGFSCRQIQCLDFDSFVHYLQWLQTAGSKHWLSLRTIDDPEVKCCPFQHRS
ncbi:uncharacterized protein LOC108047645 isoform X2 [Drosophila rhopaloa]|uniref:Uncharacterized protein LOC108047645 isoform X2 n=1 Tax=Drosophila rhopaloa TaxID=1041015 RepID=A0A6P4FD28_DRORH|nr:uncharacterized protein LOC108047645 isoform X2 [Drosophila rhopaloa]